MQQIRSSLFYQILLFCNAWYFAVYFVAEILIFIYKAETLPYPKYTLPAELVLLFVISGVEAIRNFFGQKGNLSEQMASVVISIVLTVPVFLSVLYFLLWQTYVLRLELILSAFQLGFLVLELIFGIVAIATFARAAPL